MRAAVLHAAGRWSVAEVADPPSPQAGELLVRTDFAAVCGSDVHVAQENEIEQPPGFPGHEAVGTVVESRAGGFAPGDRVLCTPPAAIARCFAELQVLPATSVVALPDGGEPARLVIAQQLGTAVFAMKRFWPAALGDGSGRTAAVLGTGPAGLAFVHLLHRAGFEVVVASDLSEVRLAAAARLGARRTVAATAEDALEVAMARTDGVGVDLVVEAAGRDATRHQAMRMVRVDGRIGLFGLEERAGMTPIPFGELFRRRPTVEMSWGAQFEDGLSSFATAVGLLGSDDLDLVSHRFGLTEIDAAFALAADPSGGAVKVGVSLR